MSARVLRFTGSRHREAERLLPWLVNGTLDDDERALVVQHLEGCGECQRELAQLHALHQACTTPVPVVDPMPSFARLRQRLATPRARPPVSRWRTASSAWTTAPPWLRGMVAAQCALLLVLGAAWITRAPPDAYRTLGDGSAAPAAGAGEGRLLVVFAPDIQQARMQQLLQDNGAHVVDGPSDAGAWVLAVPAGSATRARDALRAAPGVSLAERLDGARAGSPQASSQ